MKGKVLFDFTPSEPTHIALKHGDTIDIIKYGGKGDWSSATDSTGKVGFFPSDYIELVEELVVPAAAAAAATPPPEKGGGKLFAKVMYEYSAPGPNEMPLTTGERIEVVHRGEKGGWCMGLFGAFPTDYVEFFSEVETTTPLPRPAPAHVTASISAPTLPTPPVSAPTALPKAKVLFDYTPTVDNEMSLTAGEVIEIAFEGPKGGWSRGTAGAFPSDYVEMLPLSDISTTKQDESNQFENLSLSNETSTTTTTAAAPPASSSSSSTSCTSSIGSNRVSKRGMDKELFAKQAAKHDLNAEFLAMEWVLQLTGKDLGVEGFGPGLKSGQTLCELINAIKPGSIKKIETSAMPFKQMENITAFLKNCRALGVQEHDVFETNDLYEAKNLSQVTICLHALSRAVQKGLPSFSGPYLDIKFAAPTGVAVESAPSAMGLLSKGTQNDSSNSSTSCTMSSAERAPATPIAATPLAPSAPPAAPAPACTSAAVGARGAGFGLDAELARKQAAKYDYDAERLSIEWIFKLTGDDITAAGGFGPGLKNGQALCRLINAIKPGSIKKIETSAMPFKQMENITAFSKNCRSLGVPEHSVFETCDLYDEKDLGAVIRCLCALSLAVKKTLPSFSGPYLEVTHSAPTAEKIVAAPSTMGLSSK